MNQSSTGRQWEVPQGQEEAKGSERGAPLWTWTFQLSVIQLTSSLHSAPANVEKDNKAGENNRGQTGSTNKYQRYINSEEKIKSNV